MGSKTTRVLPPTRSAANRHNPWAYFIDERTLCKKFDRPISSLGPAITHGTLPNVGMVIPNLKNDAHDGSLGTADKWFKSWMTKIFAGEDWKSGRVAVVLTADEDDRNSGNAVDIGDPSQSKGTRRLRAADPLLPHTPL